MLKRLIRLFSLALVTLLIISFISEQAVYKVVSGSALFHSKAPLEEIKAETTDLKGLLDLSSGSFAFRVSPSTFQGFNGELQREHFNENFLETVKFPVATFSGKIIDEFKLDSGEIQTVRARGKLTIHGVEKERIIKVNMKRKGELIEIQSDFIVPLKDHNISIPRVVHQKIAEEINVEVNAILSVN